MKKLKLDVEQLEVMSFETAETRGDVGTVKGHMGATDTLITVSCGDPLSSLYKMTVTFSALCEG